MLSKDQYEFLAFSVFSYPTNYVFFNFIIHLTTILSSCLNLNYYLILIFRPEFQYEILISFNSYALANLESLSFNYQKLFFDFYLQQLELTLTTIISFSFRYLIIISFSSFASGYFN